MNPETETFLNSLQNAPDYLVVAGSKLFGTHRDNSDDDFRGFVLPDFKTVINATDYIPDGHPDFDFKVVDLREYFSLILKGDPHSLEILFAPLEKVIFKSSIADTILSQRDKFLSAVIFKRFMGFALSEWRKARGERMIIEQSTNEEKRVISLISETFQLDKPDMDEVVNILTSKKKKTIISSRVRLGKKRGAEFEKYGFGVTSAAHTIRLCQEVKEVLSTGTITFPRPNAKFLLDIRLGKYSLEELEKIYNECVSDAEEAYKNTVLPPKVDHGFLMKLYYDIVSSTFQQNILNRSGSI